MVLVRSQPYLEQLGTAVALNAPLVARCPGLPCFPESGVVPLLRLCHSLSRRRWKLDHDALVPADATHGGTWHQLCLGGLVVLVWLYGRVYAPLARATA